MSAAVKQWPIQYLAHNRTARPALIVLPSKYGPGRPTPPLPLVIAVHGRNSGEKLTASLWGDLPAIGDFAVIAPGGMGRRLKYCSWGYRRQIDDLARMPSIADNALTWLSIDRTKIYSAGGSMGGHETLLLLGQHPKLLSGAICIDGVTNFYRRYFDFALSPQTRSLQVDAQLEVGGTPTTNPTGYVLRSPTHWLKEIADSKVPLQIWWSLGDLIVEDQLHQSSHFFDELRKRRGNVKTLDAQTGFWPHMSQMREKKIPQAMAWLGLVPD